MQDTARHIKTVKRLLERHANTDEPYKKIFKTLELPKIAAAPIIKIPVPKKKDDAIDTAKYFLKMIFKKTYKLAQPKLITILPKIAHISEPTLTAKDAPTKRPARTVPNK